MTKLPRAVSLAKGIPTRQSGQVSTVSTLTDRKTGAVLDEKAVNTKLKASGDTRNHVACSGVNLGLTIPGPERSFKTARVDVFVSLPHGPSDDDVREALDRCERIADAKLVALAEDVKEYFKGE